MIRTIAKSGFSLLALMLVMLVGSTTSAQDKLLDPSNFGDPGGFGIQQPLSLTASFEILKGTNRGRLFVAAEIGEGYHVYSVTQPDGTPGPQRTQIKLDSSQVTLLGDFQPDADPIVVQEEGFTVESEKHELFVVWSAPFEFPAGIDVKKLELPISVDGQICSTSCEQFDEQLTAKFSKFAKPPKTGKYRPENSHVTWHVTAEPSVVAPGDYVTLTIRGDPSDGYHLYRYEVRSPREDGFNPTLIALKKKNPFIAFKTKRTLGELSDDYLNGPVEWSIQLQAPVAAEPATHQIVGLVGFQTCTESTCDKPDAIEFELPIVIGSETGTESVEASIKEAAGESGTKRYEGVATEAEKYAAQINDRSIVAILQYLGIAFLAGLILNVMPCVLPVIGLKVMGFVQQAGDKPLQIFMLNAVFALGMMSVFWALAILAISVSGFSWGMQFQSNTFKFIMIGIVFAFGLSFLGVWEIPIPGFVGSGKTGKLAEKEGVSGAFFKGVLTTLLATPCSGPMLGPAVGWAVAQPAWLTFVVFTALGLGMSFPFLAIGAFPKLMSWLPKPGNWMVTFKQIMGFVLLGTVVFLFNAVTIKYVVPVMTVLIGIGLACWLIGRVSLAAEFGKKARVWILGTLCIVISYLVAFYVIIPPFELDWKEYSRAELDRNLNEGNPVFVDFTADW